MNFLEKFKGKTTFLKTDQVGLILGSKSSTSLFKQNPNHLHLLRLTQIPEQNDPLQPQLATRLKKETSIKNSPNLKASEIKQKAKKDQNTQQNKKILQNPFLIQNQFFLDEEQRQAFIKKRKEAQNRERVQKQRKKKQQIQQQMKKSIRNSPEKDQKLKKKQWIKLGGLGANIGGEQWTKKKKLQQKMLKFAEEIKKINTEKFEGTFSQSMDLKPNKPFLQKLKQRQVDSRTAGIKYSKLIQKPAYYTFQKPRYLNREMRTYNSDFQGQAPRQSSLQSTNRQEGLMDPEDNEFSNLKIQRNHSQFQKLQNRHRELKNLIRDDRK